MIKIAVSSPEIVERKGVGKTSGKDYHLRIQTAHAFTVSTEGVVSEYPDKFEILLDKDQPPYARGNYTLSPSAVFVGREGRMEVRPRLVPLAASKA
jgi:hypothetical protein